MENEDPVYRKLQRHLNSQAVGFPATKSGAEIRILKHIFTPQEARIATFLTYRFEPVETVFERAKNSVESIEQLEESLESMEEKGGVESKIKNGKKVFCIPPLVVGMYEFQIGRLTPEFIKDFDDYTNEMKFGIEFVSTQLPQMRTIPIAKSIQPKHNVSTYDEVAMLVKNAEPPFVVMECICRKKKALLGEPCQTTDRKEVCLAFGNIAQASFGMGQVEKSKWMRRCRSLKKIKSRAWFFSHPIPNKPSSFVHAADAAAACSACRKICRNRSISGLPIFMPWWMRTHAMAAEAARSAARSER